MERFAWLDTVGLFEEFTIVSLALTLIIIKWLYQAIKIISSHTTTTANATRYEAHTTVRCFPRTSWLAKNSSCIGKHSAAHWIFERRNELKRMAWIRCSLSSSTMLLMTQWMIRNHLVSVRNVEFVWGKVSVTPVPVISVRMERERRSRQVYNFYNQKMLIVISLFFFPILAIPIAVSLPHFYKSDPRLADEIEGMKPEQERHETVVQIEPVRYWLSSSKYLTLLTVLTIFHMSFRHWEFPSKFKLDCNSTWWLVTHDSILI